MDKSITALVIFTFAALVVAVVVRAVCQLFTRGTDPQAPLTSRVASLPRAFREFRAQRLSAREIAGWLIVGVLMFAIIVAKSLK